VSQLAPAIRPLADAMERRHAPDPRPVQPAAALPATAEPRRTPLERPVPVVIAPPTPARRDVHVRIGTVEIRAETSALPAPVSIARRSAPARGFDDYRAVRSHTAWDV
jgi:hypothetical protein